MAASVLVCLQRVRCARLNAKWTQSKTFYFISEEMFEKLAGKWDRIKDEHVRHTKEAVAELLSLLTEENRGKLLKRLGSLNLIGLPIKPA